MAILPKQRVSKAERTNDWYIDNAKYRIDQTSYWSSDRWELVQLYRAAAGYLDKDAYEYVLNPYNSTDENLSNYPAALRNYDIIGQILSSFLGEKAEIPFNHQIVVANPDSPNINKEQQDEAFSRAVAQHFVNDLNSVGHNTGVKSQEVPAYEKILEQYQVDTVDKRAIFGQEALDYLKYWLQLKDKYQEGFYDWLVTGRVFTYKDVLKDDVTHEIVPVLEMWHGTTGTGMIEDAEWAVRRSRFNLSRILDRFNKELSKEEIDSLEEKVRHGYSGATLSFGNNMPNIDKAANISTTNNSALAVSGDLIDVWHITWKGMCKVGILTYKDELGGIQETEVSEDYKFSPENGDINIEWEYDGCVYEVYRIADDIYKCMRPILVQRNQLSNSSVVKLPYHGRVGYNERGTVNSIAKQLLPYQALYNIYHFRRELILARNKDKIGLMPIGLIPDEFGAGFDGMSKYLHFVETTGFAFFDEQKEGAMAVLNAIKAIDISLGTYVSGMTDLIRSIKEEAWEAVGMNRQRYGETYASDGKGVNEQAVIRGSLITKELNRRFTKFEELDIQGLIEYSKLAWINGKKGMYINSEGRRAFLEVDSVKHLDTDYGVFAIDGMEEQGKLKQGKDFAFGWAQKSTIPAGIVLEVLDSNNMSGLKAKVKRAEQLEKEYQDSIRQQEQQNAQLLQDKKDQVEANKNNTAIQVAQIKAHADIITTGIGGVGTEGSNNGEVDVTELLKVQDTYNKYIDNLRKNDESRQVVGKKAYNDLSSKRLDEAKISLQEKKMENDLKIAKQNKNKYD